MYVPEAFAETDLTTLHALMHEHPLATVVSLNADRLQASHVPLVLYPDEGPFGTLRGHLARANPQWSTLDASVDGLCIFHGPEAYITPSWYESKKEHGKVVPTWNYVTVHAGGPLKVIKDADWLLTNVNAVTDQHEADRAERWRVSDAPDRFVQTMLRGIVGIEICISQLDGKWKLSQNRPDEDRQGVVQGLADEHGADEAISRVTAERAET
ncbi:MAG: FMN-binding negative transcriptional regulator [Alphaproteobacteria bacterium]|nr:FMN-binding negative transcriptional regulator [Alphaproteobacteria bacterium]